VNHAKRQRCRAREFFPRSSAADAVAIRCVEEAWKATRSALRTDSFLRTAPFEYAHLRRYFGVETEAAPGDRSQPTTQSLIVCSRVSRDRYYLQDFLRRPDAPRGATEMAVVEALERLRRDGIRIATMGIVPFFGPTPSNQRDGLARVAERVMRKLVYRFDGLGQFRSKFAASQIEPVYAVHHPKYVSPLAVWDLLVTLAPRAGWLRRVGA
jgi:hypothetical protein